MGSRYRLPKSFHIHINNRIPEFTNTFTHSRILSPFYVVSLCLLCCNKLPIENQSITQNTHKQQQPPDFQPIVQ